MNYGILQGKLAKVFGWWTVITEPVLRYYSMSDIFGLAYLVGQIED
jgi:hypothetical protein